MISAQGSAGLHVDVLFPRACVSFHVDGKGGRVVWRVACAGVLSL